ncbi:SMP-30/gluconolactonase/LRE family protein [Nonomuraea polychroma]|uniref:SMP-30/gluconolactonase/LRE family protein n=1 Tax=Nonomuraea polychroma TaxID=46176 RepID=UPI001F4E0190|nr:SMP-30/gluconolactonase/LRE family protein [Nonomuraea polychroma]
MTDPLAYHGEGPVWAESWGGLKWVDMFAGDLLSLDPDTGTVHRDHLTDTLTSIRPAPDGGIVAAVDRGFAVFQERAGRFVTRSVTRLWADPSIRMNDGACDPQGRFYAGSYDTTGLGRGVLHRLDPDGTHHVVLRGIDVSNGLDWSEDGLRAFYVDSPTQRIDILDFDPIEGRFGGRRPFAHVHVRDGVPDGLAVDAKGGVWVALYGGGCVRRYHPGGTWDRDVRLPVARVTACTFGGPRLDWLYVTTSRENASAPEPSAGALFRIPVDVPGVPVRAFGMRHGGSP